MKERERSDEQLERERERRWRNGEEESQRREEVEVLVCVQGSLEVGMSSDWRALSCLGSSVVLLPVAVERKKKIKRSNGGTFMVELNWTQSRRRRRGREG